MDPTDLQADVDYLSSNFSDPAAEPARYQSAARRLAKWVGDHIPHPGKMVPTADAAWERLVFEGDYHRKLGVGRIKEHTQLAEMFAGMKAELSRILSELAPRPDAVAAAKRNRSMPRGPGGCDCDECVMAIELTRLHALRGTTISGRPRIVCLCGSTRFYEVFQRHNYLETMAGRIVLSVGFYRPSPESESERNRYEHHGESIGCTPEQKVALDELHKRKIDLADEILVLNVGGYIGESTRSEIEYAERVGKGIRWLEPRGTT